MYVEGGYGRISTARIAGIKDGAIKKELVENLLENGSLTGGEYFSITAYKPDILTGIEDKEIHRQNIARLGLILEKKEHFEKAAGALGKELGFMQAKYMSPESRKFNRLIEDYKKGKIEAAEYYKRLFAYADRINENPGDYQSPLSIKTEEFPGLAAYASLIRQGKKLNYGKVSGQMQQFIQELKSRISFNLYNSLLEKTGNFSKVDELYVYLAQLAKKPGASAGAPYQDWVESRFPELCGFFRYIENNRAINPLKIIEEERRLTEDIRVALAGDRSGLEVAFLADFFPYFKGFLLNSITAQDYEYFKSRFAKFKTVWLKYAYDDKIGALEKDFALLNEFYGTNEGRNTRFLNNIEELRGERKTQAAASGAARGALYREAELVNKLKNTKIIAVITGGFHTRGLNELLRERNISYINITPGATKEDKTAARVYARLAMRQALEINGETHSLERSAKAGGDMINAAASPAEQLALALASQSSAPKLFELTIKALDNKIKGAGISEKTRLIREIEEAFGEKASYNTSRGELTFENGTVIKLGSGEITGEIVSQPAGLVAEAKAAVYELLDAAGFISRIVFGDIYSIARELFEFAAANNILTGNGLIYEIVSDPALSAQEKIDGIEKEILARFPDFAQAIISEREKRNINIHEKAGQEEWLKVLLLADLFGGIIAGFGAYGQEPAANETEQAAAVHSYSAASFGESDRLINELMTTLTAGYSEYIGDFSGGILSAGKVKPGIVRETNIVELIPRDVFHEGLIKDEDGIYWIVKKQDIFARDRNAPDRKIKDTPSHEMLAWLISQGRSNMAEIRFLSPQELKGVDFINKDELYRYYLTRLVVPSNIDASKLAVRDRARAFNANFVTNILLRKWDQHYGNIAFAGDLPVTIDNDEVLPFYLFDNRGGGINRFYSLFLYHSVFSTAKTVKPLSSDWSEDYRALVALMKQTDYATVRAYFLLMFEKYGLGAGLTQAESLNETYLRESIENFKSLDSDTLQRLCEQAGYEGRELENAVNFLLENHARLGQDVNELYYMLSGKDAELDLLDSGGPAQKYKDREKEKYANILGRKRPAGKPKLETAALDAAKPADGAGKAGKPSGITLSAHLAPVFFFAASLVGISPELGALMPGGPQSVVSNLFPLLEFMISPAAITLAAAITAAAAIFQSIGFRAKGGAISGPEAGEFSLRLEKAINERAVPLLSADIESITDDNGLLGKTQIKSIKELLRSGGNLVLHSSSGKEWFYKKIIGPLAEDLNRNDEIHLLGRLYFALNSGREIFAPSQQSFELINQSQEPIDKDGILGRLTAHLNGRGMAVSVVSHIGDFRDTKITPLGGYLPENTVPVSVGKIASGEFEKETGPGRLFTVQPVRQKDTARIFSYAAARLYGKYQIDSTQAGSRGNNNLSWTFENRARIADSVSVGGPGFVWATQTPSPETGQTAKTFLVPLLSKNMTEFTAALPEGADAFTFFWSGAAETVSGRVPGRWDENLYRVHQLKNRQLMSELGRLNTANISETAALMKEFIGGRYGLETLLVLIDKFVTFAQYGPEAKNRYGKTFDAFQNYFISEAARKKLIQNLVPEQFVNILSEGDCTVIAYALWELLKSLPLPDAVKIVHIGVPQHVFLGLMAGEYILAFDFAMRKVGPIVLNMSFNRDPDTPLERYLSRKPLAGYSYLNVFDENHAASSLMTRIAAEYYDLGDHEAALAYIKESIKLGPDDPDNYYWEGLCNIELGRNDKAEQSLLKCLELVPTDPMYINAAGDFYNESGQPEKAIPLFEKTLRLYPENFDARLGLSESYMRQKNYDGALFLLKAALRTGHAKIAYAYESLAIVYQNTRKYREAAEQYLKAFLTATDDEHADEIESGLFMFLIKNRYDYREVDTKKVIEEIGGSEEWKRRNSVKIDMLLIKYAEIIGDRGDEVSLRELIDSAAPFTGDAARARGSEDAKKSSARNEFRIQPRDQETKLFGISDFIERFRNPEQYRKRRYDRYFRSRFFELLVAAAGFSWSVFFSAPQESAPVLLLSAFSLGIASGAIATALRNAYLLLNPQAENSLIEYKKKLDPGETLKEAENNWNLSKAEFVNKLSEMIKANSPDTKIYLNEIFDLTEGHFNGEDVAGWAEILDISPLGAGEELAQEREIFLNAASKSASIMRGNGLTFEETSEYLREMSDTIGALPSAEMAILAEAYPAVAEMLRKEDAGKFIKLNAMLKILAEADGRVFRNFLKESARKKPSIDILLSDIKYSIPSAAGFSGDKLALRIREIRSEIRKRNLPLGLKPLIQGNKYDLTLRWFFESMKLTENEKYLVLGMKRWIDTNKLFVGEKRARVASISQSLLVIYKTAAQKFGFTPKTNAYMLSALFTCSEEDAFKKWTEGYLAPLIREEMMKRNIPPPAADISWADVPYQIVLIYASIPEIRAGAYSTSAEYEVAKIVDIFDDQHIDLHNFKNFLQGLVYARLLSKIPSYMLKMLHPDLVEKHHFYDQQARSRFEADNNWLSAFFESGLSLHKVLMTHNLLFLPSEVGHLFSYLKLKKENNIVRPPKGLWDKVRGELYDRMFLLSEKPSSGMTKRAAEYIYLKYRANEALFEKLAEMPEAEKALKIIREDIFPYDFNSHEVIDSVQGVKPDGQLKPELTPSEILAFDEVAEGPVAKAASDSWYAAERKKIEMKTASSGQEEQLNNEVAILL